MPESSSSSLLILTTGGTIDKVYFDATSEYEIGDPTIPHIFHETGATVEHRLVSLMRKDSLDLTDEDRELIRSTCAEATETRILITHGTDTMTQTAGVLEELKDKTIVLTGAMAPARFRTTDAIFNIGCGLGAVQSKPPGVYIAMNGRIFDADKVRKNRDARRFEDCAS